MSKIILFDGDCNFCDQSVQFIMKRDPKQKFKFASLQSEAGIRLVKECKIPEDVDSLVYISDSNWYIQSSAALRISKHLKGIWKLGVLFLVMPKTWRDAVYQVIARNRYTWFGKKESCRLPTQEDRGRFLE
ncbi:thiol-disulfide oxidoreductase DCC family protein [Virgibacillus sp. SK37]|uniref:thiol-disulfide oxidoreductase DCC family protein n=1 Tax=Virgibacillus sp. SK37 TaxID=403957 RepID=UPI0004D0BC63|nr:DCC1-like thiol-disulfide oxidoreductase family protein [Virgibacillus sp. SK37]AIF42193.1 hypothetical protein X953_01930 [Virgibacillus sp. SK37]